MAGGMRKLYPLSIAAAFAMLFGAWPAAASVGAEPRLVAITFDDLPFADVSAEGRAAAVKADRAIRRVLVRNRVPAIGFVTEKHVQVLGPQGTSMLRAWLRNGFELGNHGATHASVNTHDLAGIRREIIEGESTVASVAQNAGKPLRFYRFAYNHVGDTEEKRTAIERLLAEHGYRLAASTIDTSDYLFEKAYTRAVGNRALQRRIELAYLEHSRAQIRYYQALNRRVLGREPPAIMLLHSNRLNAATLDRLLRIFRVEGFDFVSLDRAQADEAYRSNPAFATRHGLMCGYRWARERRVVVDGSKEPRPPTWLENYALPGS